MSDQTRPNIDSLRMFKSNWRIFLWPQKLRTRCCQGWIWTIKAEEFLVMSLVCRELFKLRCFPLGILFRAPQIPNSLAAQRFKGAARMYQRVQPRVLPPSPSAIEMCFGLACGSCCMTSQPLWKRSRPKKSKECEDHSLAQPWQLHWCCILQWKCCQNHINYILIKDIVHVCPTCFGNDAALHSF